MSSYQRRLLVIVSRTALELAGYVKFAFEPVHGDVFIDRRFDERRRRKEAIEIERRRGERRQRDITGELWRFGWVLVRQ
jgi:hypothetical protein